MGSKSHICVCAPATLHQEKMDIDFICIIYFIVEEIGFVSYTVNGQALGERKAGKDKTKRTETNENTLH